LPSDDFWPLLTKVGSLDVLGAIGNGQTYEDLLPHSGVQELHADLSVKILDLETLIAIKEHSAQEKDRAVLTDPPPHARREPAKLTTTGPCG
jgi:hypothetical protein